MEISIVDEADGITVTDEVNYVIDVSDALLPVHSRLGGVGANDHHNEDHGSRHVNGEDNIQDATASQKGLMTAAYAGKLDGVETGATADQSAAEIKALYEANSDTNEFSDAEETKLAGIESGATADQSAAEIKTAYDSLNDGWVEDSETWTRTGDHSFTIAADVTDKYRKGVKVRYKQGGGYEYGVVASASYSSPNTTITLISNSDYAMAAGSVTDTAFSMQENPESFPDWFDYAVNWTGFSSDPSGVTAKWRASGQVITVSVHATGDGTSNATTFYVSKPVETVIRSTAGVRAKNNGSYLTYPAMAMISAGADIRLFTSWAGAGWTASGAKNLDGLLISYQF